MSQPLRFVLAALAPLLILPNQCFASASPKQPAKQVKQIKQTDPAGPAYSPEYGVRVIYFIPKNRKPQSYAIKNIKNYTKIAQQFFSSEMARYGYYKPGTKEGKTFACDTDKNGEPYVHIIHGIQDDSFYAESIYSRVVDEMFTHFSKKNSVVLVMTECDIIHEDGSITGGAMGGTSFLKEGPLGGYAIIGGDTLWLLDKAKWDDNRKYDGLRLPWFNNIPLVQGVSYPAFQGDTVSSNSGVYFGAITHELGHGFDLPHCFCGDNFGVTPDLMGNGCRAFVARFGKTPEKGTGMCRWDIDLIATSRYFNPEKRTDFAAPVEKYDVVLEKPGTPDVNIHVKLAAKDTGSGLFRNVVAILPPGTNTGSTGYDKNGKADFRVKPSDIPVTGLTPQSYTLFLRPIDKQGNRGEEQIWVPVPGSIGQQYCDNDGNWVTVEPGGHAANGNVRLALSLTGPDAYTSVTPEVEIQPTGTPFTGVPNYVGPTFSYDKAAVTVNIPVVLAPGKYHWRYRIKSNNKDFPMSCWVAYRTDDTSDSDIEASASPAFISYPKSQTRCTGQKTVLSVKTVGAMPINYQWKKNGTDISGATSPNYTIESAVAKDAGTYECTIHNTAGSLTTKPAKISVVEGTPAVITAQSGNETVNWTWGTNVARGKPVKASHAFKYDQPENVVDGNIERSPRWTTYSCGGDPQEWIEIDLQGTYSIGAINARVYDDDSGVRAPSSCEYYYKNTSGEWKLIAVNGAPEASFDGSKANTLLFEPVQATAVRLVLKKNSKYMGIEGIGLTEFEVFSGCSGKSVTLSVSATGSGPISYQWQKDGANIPGATAPTYTIPIAIPQHAGMYDCVIKNACTDTESSPVKLTVQTIPATH